LESKRLAKLCLQGNSFLILFGFLRSGRIRRNALIKEGFPCSFREQDEDIENNGQGNHFFLPSNHVFLRQNMRQLESYLCRITNSSIQEIPAGFKMTNVHGI